MRRLIWGFAGRTYDMILHNYQLNINFYVYFGKKIVYYGMAPICPYSCTLHNLVTFQDMSMNFYRNMYKSRCVMHKNDCPPFLSFQVKPLWLFKKKNLYLPLLGNRWGYLHATL